MNIADDVIDIANTPKRRRGLGRRDREKFVSEDTRRLCALILLQKGMSATRVAIQPQVMLPFEKVLEMDEALKAIS